MRTQTTFSSSQQETTPKSFLRSSSGGLATQRHLQLKTIAVLTDLGDDSDKLLRYAASLAQWYGSKLIIAHMSPTDVYHYISSQPFPAWPVGVLPLKEKAEKRIESLISKTGVEDVTTEVVINESSIGDLLRDLESRRPDLLILATHGREGIKKMLIGSITEEVFRRVEWPVLVLGPHTRREDTPPIRFRKVFCAIDLSAASVSALRYAAAMAEDHEAQLIVLHVETGSIEGFSFDRVMALQGLRDWVHSHVLAQGDVLRKAEYEIEFGQPENEILKAAAEFRPDAIVIGARGLGAAAGLASHFVGGTAYEVATQSNCPVLIVPRSR